MASLVLLTSPQTLGLWGAVGVAGLVGAALGWWVDFPERCSLQVPAKAIAGLTAIDGAAILTDRYELLAFGAKIQRRRGSSPVETVTVTEPVEGGMPTVLNVSQLGGTRHLSAAQFVYDQRNAIALVASQDRRFTVFAWSPCEESVHAHRVEVLLL